MLRPAYHRIRYLFTSRVALAIGVLCAPGAWGAEVSFRDDFETPTLAEGWTFVREDAATHSLTARPGFFRIHTQRGDLAEKGNVKNLLLRGVSGDFLLQTRLEFNPRAAQQSAGLLVYRDDGNGVALGLTFVGGERGTFRGVALVSVVDNVGDPSRPAAFYDEATAVNPNVVHLRLLRSGNQFVAGYSPDGRTFTDLGTLTSDLPDAIRVGLAAGNGDYEECGSDCDIAIPADFDSFQISTLGDGPGVPGDDGVTLESVTIDGPDEVRGGSTAGFTAIASFSDGSVSDVTEEAEWMVAPPSLGDVDAGVFTAADVDSMQQATVVATYTHLTSGGTANASGAALIRITSAPTVNGVGVAPPCGAGLLMVTWFGWLPLLSRIARRGRAV